MAGMRQIVSGSRFILASTCSTKPGTLCTNKTWIGRADCRHCGVQAKVLFSGLSDAELDSILRPIDIYCYPRKSSIYNELDPTGWVYTLRCGLVKLVRYLPDGTARIVRLLKPGDAFGLESMVGEKYDHSAIAVRRTEVCRIPVSVLTQLEKTSTTLHRNLVTRWEQQLQTADRFITQLGTGTLRRRVASLIDVLCEISCGGEVCRVDLLGRDDIAAVLGVRVESVSRIIAELKRENILHHLGNDQYEVDLAALSTCTDG